MSEQPHQPQKAYRDLLKLQEITRDITAELDLKKLLARILDAVIALVEAGEL